MMDSMTSGKLARTVDIEVVRPIEALDAIAADHFSTHELAELRRQHPERRQECFFHCWTRKEAYIKAIGGGLSIPLDSFSVSLTPGMPEQLHSSDQSRWILRTFQPAEGYTGALVTESPELPLRYWTWETESLPT